MRRIIPILTFAAGLSFAHHGVASLGSAGLEGPGAPLESSSSATLPEGKWLLYLKLDHVKWKKYSFSDFPDQKDEYYFWMYGIGYGLKPWLSLYLFLPYYVKKEIKTLNSHSYSYTNSGFSDLSLMAVLGFKYDKGLKLVPRQESLDDLMDWHFTLYGGVSVPTGDPNKYDRVRDPKGDFEPDMSVGFGKPSITIGFTATKQFISFPRLTFVLDTSYLKFFEHTYSYVEEDRRKKYKFGDEFRLNSAIVYRTYENADRGLRIDTILEANFQHNEKDREDGIKQSASGGNILYGTGGIRLYYKNTSLGMGLKVPLWKRLNEEKDQQGGEGKERYRFILTFSALF
ncbi:MAG: transporter [Aquificaceae bacterium]